MSPLFTPAAMMSKAHQACKSARILLANGDVDGACNRAYYAMFDAARAALLSTSRLLNRGEEVRLVADYNGESVTLDDASAQVTQAELFVTTVDSEIINRTPNRE